MRDISIEIKKIARDHGFDLVGITNVEPLIESSGHLKTWLERGFHADMKYMERNFKLRINPALHLKSAKSVIMLGINYFNKKEVSDAVKGISIYARGYDYHKILRMKMQKMLIKIKELTGREFDSKIFVDSSPILERALAVRAGLGLFGKNSCMINKRVGSYIFLCGIIIDLELEYDEKENGAICGRCRKCIDACPTKAIVEPYIVDSRLCISYHTIENRKEIPQLIAKNMNGWIFGCDICQMVCPWNRKAVETKEEVFLPDESIKKLTLQEIEDISEDDFYKIFSNSPVRRARWTGFLRNVKISVMNSKKVERTPNISFIKF